MSWRSSYSKILMNAKKLHVFEFNRFKLLQKVNLFKAIYWTSLYFDGNNGQYSLVHGGTFKISFRHVTIAVQVCFQIVNQWSKHILHVLNSTIF